MGGARKVSAPSLDMQFLIVATGKYINMYQTLNAVRDCKEPLSTTVVHVAGFPCPSNLWYYYLDTCCYIPSPISISVSAQGKRLAAVVLLQVHILSCLCLLYIHVQNH